jgi:TonB family protein
VKYPLAVAIVLGLLLAIAHLIPSDPRALSLDTLDASGRMARMVTVPLEVTAPEIDRARALTQAAGGSGSAAAAKPSGQAGDRKSRDSAHHLTIRGTARPQDARAVAAQIHDSSLLAVLDGPRTSAFADVLADGPAMGADAKDIVGNLYASNAGSAFGLGGLGPNGTGRGGGGEGERTIGGGGPLGTTGKIGGHGGPGYGFGPGVGGLRRRQASVPDPVPGIVHVNGALDKEIIRRTVRRHLNEVKFCYEQSLVTRPSLSGRVVVQFAIAPTGRVLSSVVQRSSLGVAAVDSCIVNAVKRWEFPQPDRGGLAVVSYPFSFSPAGG